jgi:hypothetical protein
MKGTASQNLRCAMEKQTVQMALMNPLHVVRNQLLSFWGGKKVGLNREPSLS